MALFGRKDKQPGDDPRPAVAEFWRWWSEHRDEVLAAADTGRQEDVRALLGPAVAALDPDLVWDLSPGHTTKHLFVVSGSGSVDRQAIAERWRLAAPTDDPDVTYASSRPRHPDPATAVLYVDDFELPLAEATAATRVDSQRGRLDVVVHHPLFPLLAKEHRLEAAFRSLDLVLGEDEVERWLGEVEVAADPPLDPIALTMLPVVVDQLRPGSAGWAVLQGTSPQGDVTATVRRPFSRIDRPLCDTHVALLLPGAATEEQVRGAGEAALAALGGDGPHAVLVGYVITPRQSTVHLYVDGLEVDPEAARPTLKAWSGGAARMLVSRDPAWREVGYLLV